MKRGDRIVGTDTELLEKLGRNDPCSCGAGRRFRPLLSHDRPVRRFSKGRLRPGQMTGKNARLTFSRRAQRSAVPSDPRDF
jgi:hypothetical protein